MHSKCFTILGPGKDVAVSSPLGIVDEPEEFGREGVLVAMHCLQIVLYAGFGKLCFERREEDGNGQRSEEG